MICSCPPSTPKPSLRSQAGMLDAKHLIWVEKICVLTNTMHNREEQDENYAREALKEQLEEGWEGLFTEVAEICQKAGIPNACKEYIHREKSRNRWKLYQRWRY